MVDVLSSDCSAYQLLAEARVDAGVRPAVDEPPGDRDPHGRDAESGEFVESTRRICENAVDGPADDQRKQGPADGLQDDKGQRERDTAAEAFQERAQRRLLARVSSSMAVQSIKTHPRADAPVVRRVAASIAKDIGAELPQRASRCGMNW